ncbi:MAG: polynucleotide adenylyltransferase PcnB [Kiritimatiellae bacterium]|nr:polynucleotide adenylyltransferase PcnB [Kiritimatiellia bacterium]
MAKNKIKTKVLKRSEHIVSRSNIDDDAIKVMRRLKNHGFEAYLVGGGVRDLLLGKSPKDFDVSTDAHPGQIHKLFRNSIMIGRRFRLVHVMFRGKVIEVSTFRRDVDAKDKQDKDDLYQKRDNTFGTPEEDAFRRDFTVNALFYDVRSFDIIDYVGGLDDIKKQVIRCIGDPSIRFQEDPVRMLRAIRFAARLNFNIEKKTYRGIAGNYKDIKKASPARMLEEIYKLFMFGVAQPTFKLLKKTKMMSVMLPELDEFVSRGKRGKDSPLWGFLGALDGGLATVSRVRPSLMLATLYYASFKEHLEDLQSEGRRVLHEDVARSVLHDVADRYHIPKKVFYNIVHAFAMQRYFHPSNRNRISTKKLVAREAFPEALALYEIELKATGGDLKLLKPWIKLYGEYKRDNPDAEKPKRTRRRRNNSRKKYPPRKKKE